MAVYRARSGWADVGENDPADFLPGQRSSEDRQALRDSRPAARVRYALAGSGDRSAHDPAAARAWAPQYHDALLSPGTEAPAERRVATGSVDAADGEVLARSCANPRDRRGRWSSRASCGPLARTRTNTASVPLSSELLPPSLNVARRLWVRR